MDPLRSHLLHLKSLPHTPNPTLTKSSSCSACTHTRVPSRPAERARLGQALEQRPCWQCGRSWLWILMKAFKVPLFSSSGKLQGTYRLPMDMRRDDRGNGFKVPPLSSSGSFRSQASGYIRTGYHMVDMRRVLPLLDRNPKNPRPCEWRILGRDSHEDPFRVAQLRMSFKTHATNAKRTPTML